jgi:hypothetical protein
VPKTISQRGKLNMPNPIESGEMRDEMHFERMVDAGENPNGVVMVTPNTDQIGEDYLGRQQWTYGNRDGERWRAFGADPMDPPSAVPETTPMPRRSKRR